MKPKTMEVVSLYLFHQIQIFFFLLLNFRPDFLNLWKFILNFSNLCIFIFEFENTRQKYPTEFFKLLWDGHETYSLAAIL